MFLYEEVEVVNNIFNDSTLSSLMELMVALQATQSSHKVHGNLTKMFVKRSNNLNID